METCFILAQELIIRLFDRDFVKFRCRGLSLLLFRLSIHSSIGTTLLAGLLFDLRLKPVVDRTTIRFLDSEQVLGFNKSLTSR